MCIPMFIEAFFIIAKIWKKPNCLSIDEWRKPIIFIYIYTHIMLYNVYWKWKLFRICYISWIEYCAVLSHSVVFNSATPWAAAHQAPLSMDILQTGVLEWVTMPFFRGSSYPGIESRSPTLQADSFLSEPPGESAYYSCIKRKKNSFSDNINEPEVYYA